MKTFLEILEKARKMNASDVHFLVNEVPVFRVNGKLIRVEEYEKIKKEEVNNFFLSIISEREKEVFKREKEMDISFKTEDKNYRINIFLERKNIGMTVRIIKQNPLSLKELNINKKINDLLVEKNGLLIVSGKSGSGKSSTLAGIIEKFNEERNLNILTIEDPIEYIFKNKKSVIRQREVLVDTKSFLNGMKSALREDLDVIMVGELRDTKSLEMALMAAETGHFVVSTLHTNGAVDTIDRMLSMFPSEKRNFMERIIASNLIGVVYQELIEGIDGNRVPLCEILKINNGIANLIRNNKISQIQSYIDISGRNGILNREQCLKWLLSNNKISQDKYRNILREIK